jgi:hypothetical protein
MKDYMAGRLGFAFAIATALLTVLTFVIAFLTPPLSGPYCSGSCFQYPYLDIAARFPRDYYWMIPAMFLMATFLVLAVCLHRTVPEAKKVYSTIGVLFAAMSTAIFISDYFIQLSIIQPSLLSGEADGIALVSQFNPHGLFIVLEELGFICMSLSFAFFAPVFAGKGVTHGLKWLLRCSVFLTGTSFAAYTAFFGVHREYRFEVAVISINWLTLIVAGILLAIYFKKYNTAPA